MEERINFIETFGTDAMKNSLKYYLSEIKYQDDKYKSFVETTEKNYEQKIKSKTDRCAKELYDFKRKQEEKKNIKYIKPTQIYKYKKEYFETQIKNMHGVLKEKLSEEKG